MTRAASEPQLDAPLDERLGYLRHIAAGLEVASPDQLHGAAHLAPLTGLELPFLDLVADLNDVAIAGGAEVDLDELDRVLVASRERIALELERLDRSEHQPAASPPGPSRDARLAQVRLQGVAMTVEVVFVAEAASLREPLLARLDRALDEVDAPQGGDRDDVTAITEDLRRGRDGAALARTRSLLTALGIEPLGTR